MSRSEEAEAFFAAVYQAVQEIPASRVTTYGHVAALIGRREYQLSFSIRLIWKQVLKTLLSFEGSFLKKLRASPMCQATLL